MSHLLLLSSSISIDTQYTFDNQNQRTMGYLIFDYIISFIVLIVIHAPWWAWLIYVVSALVWLGIGALSDDSTNTKTTDTTKQEQS